MLAAGECYREPSPYFDRRSLHSTINEGDHSHISEQVELKRSRPCNVVDQIEMNVDGIFQILRAEMCVQRVSFSEDRLQKADVAFAEERLETTDVKVLSVIEFSARRILYFVLLKGTPSSHLPNVPSSPTPHRSLRM